MKKQRHIGVQSFGLGNALQTDLEGTIRKLKTMGFSSIEPLLVPAERQGHFPANMWSHELLKRAVAATREAGLTMPSAHIATSLGSLKLPEKKLINELRMIMQHSDICASIGNQSACDAHRAAKGAFPHLGSIIRMMKKCAAFVGAAHFSSSMYSKQRTCDLLP